MSEPETPNIPVKSVVKMFRIVALLQELDGARLMEIVNRMDLSKSTVYNHLKTLENLEYVVNEDGEYRLGFRFLDHGGHTLTRDRRIAIVEDKVQEIAAETGELCQFLIEEHGRAVIVARELGKNAVETQTRLGSRLYLHHITGGKAILAHLPEDRVREIVDHHGLPEKTEKTITDTDTLFKELAEIRERGYAFDKEEHIQQLHALGVPIKDGDTAFGALSVAGPSYRMEGEERERELADLLLGNANELELNIGFQ